MNYYKELNIDSNSSIDEIRSAYKKLALKWHPDRNPNNKEEAEKKFKIISESYQILSDKEKKKDLILMVMKIIITIFKIQKIYLKLFLKIYLWNI